jgi:predicted MPP superfamily phosphohydrolase
VEEVVKRRSIGLSVAVVLLAGWLYAARLAPRWLEVVRLRVAVPGLDPTLGGLRIAHLTDFHAGGRGVSWGTLWDARRAALAFAPDLIALTGDFYAGGVPVASDGLYGGWPAGVPVLGVLGNHDFRGGSGYLAAVVDELQRAGVRLLRNEAVSLRLRGCDAWIVGVDDAHTWQADEARAFGMLPDGVEALLYLTHSPAATRTMPVGRARIVLAGHTHGGQMRLTPSGSIPFTATLRRLLREPSKNDPLHHRGTHWVRGSLLLIANGLGVSVLPLRLFTRPQVLLIELVPTDQQGSACDDAQRYVERLARPPWLWRWLS